MTTIEQACQIAESLAIYAEVNISQECGNLIRDYKISKNGLIQWPAIFHYRYNNEITFNPPAYVHPKEGQTVTYSIVVNHVDAYDLLRSSLIIYDQIHTGGHRYEIIDNRHAPGA